MRRICHKKSLIAFAGIEPQPNDFGKIMGNGKGIRKVGSAVLRRTLFLIMTVILQTQPQAQISEIFSNRLLTFINSIRTDEAASARSSV